MLRACLESLHDHPQNLVLETIVVDNASTDGAADMVAREFPEVQLVRNLGNVGFARANNQAAQRAQGRYLLFLNNDTLVPPMALGRLVDYLEAHPEVGMVGPRLRDARGGVQISCRQRPTVAALLHRTSLLRWTGLLRSAYRGYRRSPQDASQPQAVDMLMGAALCLRRDRFWDWGGWDEDFVFGAEDMEFCCRVNRQAPVVYVPQVEIVHYGRVSTRQHITFAAPHFAAGYARYLRKTGCSRLGLWAYKLGITLDAPLQMLLTGGQYLWRRLLGRQRAAAKSLTSLRGLAAFLSRGLLSFWRA